MRRQQDSDKTMTRQQQRHNIERRHRLRRWPWHTCRSKIGEFSFSSSRVLVSVSLFLSVGVSSLHFHLFTFITSTYYFLGRYMPNAKIDLLSTKNPCTLKLSAHHRSASFSFAFIRHHLKKLISIWKLEFLQVLYLWYLLCIFSKALSIGKKNHRKLKNICIL